MKFPFALLAIILVAWSPLARAQQGPDDQYIIIYSLMQQADSMNGADQTQQALAQYVQLQGELQTFQKIFPDWNPKIVNFRLRYLAEKIAETTARLPVTNPPPAMVVAPPAPPAAPAAAANDLAAQFGALHEQMQKLQADNTTLQAKLQEALGAQPAAIDSRELDRARETIRSLLKENELLKISQPPGKTGMVAGAVPAVNANELAQARETIRSLMKENDLLKAGQPPAKVGTAEAASSAAAEALRLAQLALAEANQKLAEQTARADQLARENQQLQSRVQSLLTSPEALQALQEENAVLKKQMVALKAAVPNSAETARLNSELAEAQKQVAALQASAEVGFLEKAALENRVRQLQIAAVNSASLTPPPSQAENEAQIRALIEERDSLLAKLGEANKALYGSRKQAAAARISELSDEVYSLRARLAVDEARAVPYTPEELALFKSPAPQLAAAPVEKKSIQELPAGTASLVAEAQAYFSARQFDKAGDDYQKILQHDENNGLVLANLAMIEMEQGKLDDAEKHIKEAVAQSPNDAYNLATLGHLEFLREKYDEALDALSRAVKLDPRDPEIENFLGLALAHKGLRAQAETELRKAVQLDPNYAAAHNNLAAIYISEQPPLVEMARWHYQKALDLGQPHNPELEKLLDAKSAPTTPQ